MPEQNRDRHVEVAADGRVLGTADVCPVDDATVRADLRVEAGHRPVGVGAQLVDAVLDLPAAREGSRLEATLPAGDAESLERLRARCDDVETRPAGATCLVDATLPTEEYEPPVARPPGPAHDAWRSGTGPPGSRVGRPAPPADVVEEHRVAHPARGGGSGSSGRRGGGGDMPFAVRGVPGDGVTVVELSGEVDIDTAPRMQAALEAAIRTGAPVVIDMADVTFMDSTGFGVLVATHLQAKRVGTPVLLRAVSDRIRDLMGMLGLDAVLRIEPRGPGGIRRER
jgi:anti-anti-sigma factor